MVASFVNVRGIFQITYPADAEKFKRIELMGMQLVAVEFKHFEARTLYGRHFTDDIFKCILWKGNFGVLIQIALKFMPTWVKSTMSSVNRGHAITWTKKYPCSLLLKHVPKTQLVKWFCLGYITETKMSSFWWNFHHWLHWKLSFWQLSVQPVMKISSKWRHFRFSVNGGKIRKSCVLFSTYLS